MYEIELAVTSSKTSESLMSSAVLKRWTSSGMFSSSLYCKKVNQMQCNHREQLTLQSWTGRLESSKRIAPERERRRDKRGAQRPPEVQSNVRPAPQFGPERMQYRKRQRISHSLTPRCTAFVHDSVAQCLN